MAWLTLAWPTLIDAALAWLNAIDAPLAQLLILSGVVGDEEEATRLTVGDRIPVNDWPEADWPEADWPKADWPKADWPKADWPEADWLSVFDARMRRFGVDFLLRTKFMFK